MTAAAPDATRDPTRAALSAIVPVDETEAAHRADALRWVDSGAELCRRGKPATPSRHLVSYFVLVDRAASALLLVDHRNAGLWLPTGGHVEPGEAPAITVSRECREELGVDAALLEGLSSNPLFVTCTTTVGRDRGHVDVSLWYVVDADREMALTPDPGEFRDVAWWSLADLAGTPERTDPHVPRFARKLARELAAPDPR